MKLPLPPTELATLAAEMRYRVIDNACRNSIPHLGSCLSCLDILVAAYFSVLDIDPGTPRRADRDRFILSKGHGAPALFYVLAKRGFYPESMLDDYGKNGGVFAEHPPTPNHLPGIEAATGSLGHGLPIGLGFALAARIKHLDYRVFVTLSDGECNEGSVWEAAMLAGAQRTGCLCAIVDYNKWQATGRSNETMALAPLADKFRAFGWQAIEIDGHDYTALVGAMGERRDPDGPPLAIVAHTVKGKGVSFMEDDNNWHYRIPKPEEVQRAAAELGVTS